MAMAGTARGRSGAALLDSPAAVWHMAVGRLRPGVTREAAQAELNLLLDAFMVANPELPASYAIRVGPSGRMPAPVRGATGAFLGLLFTLTLGLLAIAGSNVAGMLLARASARRHEMASRLAVGASRRQLMGQLLVETIVLFLAAGLVALPLTIWLAAVLEAFLPTLPMPVQIGLALSARSVLFAVGIALAAGLLFGLAPARQALTTDISQFLHGRSSTTSRERMRWRHGLVVAQVALSLATAITAGLLVRSLDAMARIDPGFQMADVAVVSMDTSLVGASGERAVSLASRLVERIQAIGGVHAVGHGRVIPLTGERFGMGPVRIPGLNAADGARLDDASGDVVSTDYFRAIGMPIVAGRAFTEDDRTDRPEVAIVNETFARVAWPGQTAVGQRFWMPEEANDEVGRPIEVVGVVGDARSRYLSDDPVPFLYVPFAQHPQTRVEFFVSHVPGRSIANEVRAAVHVVEPELPVVTIQAFEEWAALALLPQRFAAWIAGVAASIGTGLAALGLYGLVALLVAQRRREFAIRMALGATGRQVLSLVMSLAARLGAAGAIGGLAIALGLGITIDRLRLLVDVAPVDPLTYGGLVAVMASIVLAASYLPARRAATADPAAALRAE